MVVYLQLINLPSALYAQSWALLNQEQESLDALLCQHHVVV